MQVNSNPGFPAQFYDVTPGITGITVFRIAHVSLSISMDIHSSLGDFGYKYLRVAGRLFFLESFLLMVSPPGPCKRGRDGQAITLHRHSEVSRNAFETLYLSDHTDRGVANA